MKKIGLTQRVDEAPSYGERRDGLDQQWALLLAEAGCLPVPLMNRLADPEAAVETLRLDGVILTGGNDLAAVREAKNPAPERDAFERRLLAYCGARRVPVLAVCRGLQMLAVSHGATLCPVQGHVATRHPVRAETPPARRCPIPAEVNSFHAFGIDGSSLPPALAPLAWAEDGTVEAVAGRDLPQVGVMWHPERERPFSRQDIALLRLVFEELS